MTDFLNNTPNIYTRRDFVKTLTAGLAAGATFIGAYQEKGYNGIPLRRLGKTNEKIPILGLGGWTIGRKSVAEADGIAIMHEAIDEGLRFFDNCWDYNAGESEIRMGKALKESWRREKVFLMTKPCGRTYTDAKSQLEDSLKRLKTDYIDLWMFHGIKRMEDRNLIFGKDGALKAALEAKKEGKIRYIGFTGHHGTKYHLNMLEEDFDWDAVLLPLNLYDYHYESFQHQVLPKLNDRNISAIGMKALLAGRLPQKTDIDPKLARKFVLSLPITSLLCGIETREQLHQDLSVARNFKPINNDEMKTLLAATEPRALTGELENYKNGKSGCNWHFIKNEGYSGD